MEVALTRGTDGVYRHPDGTPRDTASPEPALAWLARLKVERDDLEAKSKALTVFMLKGRPSNVSPEAWALLKVQWNIMEAYHETLLARIKLAEKEGA